MEGRIKEIKERTSKLPPAPWHTTKFNSRTRIYSDFAGKPNYFVDVSGATPRVAEFIAHAVEDVPHLLSELQKYKSWYAQAAKDCTWAEDRVDELEKENERLRSKIWVGPFDEGD